jgi:hypothetical protein
MHIVDTVKHSLVFDINNRVSEEGLPDKSLTLHATITDSPITNAI